MKIKEEALRYLGYKGAEPDSATAALLDRAYKELSEAAAPKFCYKVLDKKDCGGILAGNDIYKHLEGCERVIIFAATLGNGADKLIRSAEISDMAYAIVADALSSAMIEEYCDNCEKEMKEKTGGNYTWRYSPGYGDYPIECQGAFLAALNAGRLIGLTVTESNILLPRKSVTAVIGISEKKIESSEKRGCDSCKLRETCKFRKEGKGCGR